MIFGFRVDAALDIGSGHVMRCLTLARELARRGCASVFVCREHQGNMVTAIRGAGFEAISLPLEMGAVGSPSDHSAWIGSKWYSDAAQSREIFTRMDCDFVVVDHYGLDGRWERAVSPSGRVAVIDDLANRGHACALLLDQTLAREPTAYRALVPTDCLLLCGTEFALLRPQFAEVRQRSLAERSNRSAQHILVSMGGVDRDNATGQVLQALAALPEELRFSTTIVMGPNAPWLSAVSTLAANSGRDMTVCVDVSEMADLLARTDLAIGAAGSSAWERCCLGVPTVMAVIAENQAEISRAIAARGAAIAIGRPGDDGFATKVSQAVGQLLSAPTQLAEMSKAAASICDGQGVERVADRLLELGSQ
jgi:UDP-2,4-diacetamido-2,4,6-trideoxy-beta-L-altropyranose hydrolase